MDPKPTTISSVTKAEYLKFLATKREILTNQLSFISKRVLSDFATSCQISLKNLKIDSPIQSPSPNPDTKSAPQEISYASLIEKTIPFCDNYNRTIEKISNLSHHKKFLNSTCLDISRVAKDNITSEEMKIGKKNFDTVCDYTFRKKENISHTKDLYKEPLCKYLMLKTFRKSAVDAFQSLCRVDFSKIFGPGDGFYEPSAKLRIGCLGGGPGSDLTGVLAFFIDMERFYDFECTIYDSKA
jgi:hypothetical protein